MANEKKNVQEAQSPIKGQFPNRDKIACKDCKKRDRTVVKVGSKEIPFGVTKAFCEKYVGPPDDNGKPHDVLFENANCAFYEKE